MSGEAEAEAVAERRRIAAALREEARTILVESGLLALLQGRYGQATITGSAGYDLMVWRDLDMHVPCEAESWQDWLSLALDIGREFERRGLVLADARYVNHYVEPHVLGTGLRWAIAFDDFAENRWTCEIWGWEPFDYAVRQARDANLRADLGAADRDLILRLKHEAQERGPYYTDIVTSHDIYEFVIGRVGKTLEELEAWRGLA